MLTYIDGFSSGELSSPQYSIDWHLSDVTEPGYRQDLLRIKEEFEEEIMELAGKYRFAARFRMPSPDSVDNVLYELRRKIVIAETNVSNIMFDYRKFVKNSSVETEAAEPIVSIDIKHLTEGEDFFFALNGDFSNIIRGLGSSERWKFLAKIAAKGDEGVKISYTDAKRFCTYINSEQESVIYSKGRYLKTAILRIKRNNYIKGSEAIVLPLIPIRILTDRQWNLRLKKASSS